MDEGGQSDENDCFNFLWHFCANLHVWPRREEGKEIKKGKGRGERKGKIGQK